MLGDPLLTVVMVRAESDGTACQGEQLLGRGEQRDDFLRVIQRIDRCPPLGPEADQSALAKTGKVLGDGTLRKAQMFGEINHPVLTELKMLQDHKPRRITQSMEERRGGSHRLGCSCPEQGVRGRLRHRHMTML